MASMTQGRAGPADGGCITRLSEALHAALRRKVPRSSVHRVAFDLALVATGLRTATLIDAFTPSFDECGAMVRAMTSVDGCWLAGVHLILYAPAQQVFAVNATAIHKRLERLAGAETASAASNSQEPAASRSPSQFTHQDAHIFVCAHSGRPSNVPMPHYVVAAATAVARACREAPVDASVCCMLCSSHEKLAFARACGVALAGWLLEYPVCYTLEEDSQPLELAPAKSTEEARAAWENADAWSPMTTNLGNEPLLLVRATLQVAQEVQCRNALFPHDVMAFSIPEAIPQASEHAVREQKNILITLKARLQVAAAQPSTQPALRALLAKLTPHVDIQHVTQDVVAL